MPFYSYHCPRCDRMHDAYRHVSERHNSPACCDEPTKLVIVAPQVAPDLPGYESPVTGQWVEGRASRREDLKRSGCRPYEGREQEEKEFQRQQQYAEHRDNATRYGEVAKAFYALPEAKRRILTRG